jgi:hypothetical protein
MGLMEIIQQLMDPNQGKTPPGATPPYMLTNQGAQTPGPAPATAVSNPVTPMLPGVPKPQGNVPYDVGPPKSLAGDLDVGPDQLPGPPRAQGSELLEPILPNQISVPQREKAETWASVPWHKDKDRMSMILASLSNGFGNMTLRGNSGMRQMNNMLMKTGMEKQEENKTMQYLAKNNPELFKVMTKVPPGQRGDYMKLAMESRFRKSTGADDTADIRNYEYFNSLDDDGQKEFLGLKRGEKHVVGTDGSVRVHRPDGSTYWAITPEQALAGTYSSKSATDVATADSANIDQLATFAKKSSQQIPLLQEELEIAMDPTRAEGIFAPIEKMYNALQAELGEEYNTDIKGATADQLLKAGSARRVMEWFAQSGLGARGMDTPAEYNRLLEAFGGLESMTPQAYATLLKRLIRDKERSIEDYNAALESGRYSDVYNSTFYQPQDMPWRNQVNTPPPPPGTTLDGQP